jgi:hypothetical protein
LVGLAVINLGYLVNAWVYLIDTYVVRRCILVVLGHDVYSRPTTIAVNEKALRLASTERSFPWALVRPDSTRIHGL